MKSKLSLLFLVLIIFHVTVCSNVNKLVVVVAALDAKTEADALLSFKLGISVDPQNALSGWNFTSSHCTWFGVSCTAATGGDSPRVSSLNLTRLGLFGLLSPHLSNLTSLQIFDLSNNKLYGQIATLDFSRLSLLKQFSLLGNSITGTIPPGLSNSTNLVEIHLGFNNLTGHLPPQLGALPRLRVLDFAGNSLTGLIPPTFGNLSALSTLALARNELSGEIPYRLGELPKIVNLFLSNNQFTGEFPLSVFNISSLVNLSVVQNNLTGKFTSGFSLPPNLGQLFLGENLFEGSIPESLFSNRTKIQRIDLSMNRFQGPIPSSFGKTNKLVFLNLGSNNLSSTTEQNSRLFDSLANCTQFDTLILYSNRLAGELPSSIGNLSTVLTNFCLGQNLFTGTFPAGIGKFRNLISLDIQKNFFTGVLPESIGKLEKLQKLTLQQNQFSGEIPDVFGNLTQLFLLAMGANRFTGKIPSSLCLCPRLTTLDIAGNGLVGSFPKEMISGIQNLQNLYLATNSLNGSLPIEIGTLKQLEFLDVSHNKFSGNLPETIGGCLSLRSLVMSTNNLTGSIPNSVAKLVGLQTLDLSSNHFSGPIPVEFQKLKFLEKLNLSFNDVEGEVPRNGVFDKIGWDSFQGNSKLCASDKDFAGKLRVPTCVLKKSKHSLLRIVILVGVGLVTFVSAIFCFVWAFFSRKMEMKTRTKGGSSPSVKGLPPKISYADIQIATNGFAEENLIGEGSFGSVYRGEFDGEGTLAVKVIDLNQSKALKSFNAECDALRRIRHRNLVRAITSCSSIDQRGREFKALVMEFMPNGSLDMWLHPKSPPGSEGRNLSLTQRLDIAIDVASAMDYLHHDCVPPVVHCDLKPPNILLDDDLGAHVGDFGLARFLHPHSSENKSSTIGLKGSIGFIAPEYGLGSKTSTRGDVYSFGILLLQIFTGKRPTDEMFKDGLSLSKFASAEEHNDQVLKMVDARLFMAPALVDGNHTSTSVSSSGVAALSNSSNNSNIESIVVMSNWDASKIEQCIAALIRVGLSCAADSERDRPTMREALAKLHEVKKILLG